MFKKIIYTIAVMAGLFLLCLSSEAVTRKVTQDGQVWYQEYVHAEELKYSWDKAEIEEMQRKAVEEQKATEDKLYELTHQLRHFEGTEEEKKKLEKYVNDLKSGKISVNADHLIAERINKSIKYWSEVEGVEASLIRAVMKRESNFNPTVTSKSGAQGLMQIMPATGKYLKLNNPWDIDENMRAGTQYLRDQIKAFNNDYSLALAAYNAGPNAVRRAGNKIPNYAETKAYVPYVLKWYNIYKGGN